MGNGVPLLNEYKQTFLFKRIPQTILGGLKLKLGYDAPAYVYFQQLILWLVPVLLGCIFTVVLEVAYTDDEVSEFLLLYSCLYGGCIVIFVVVVQTITTVVHLKEKENSSALPLRKKKNILAEEDEVEFETCCGAETLAFVIPPKKYKINIALHALLSGLVCGVGFWYLLPYSVNQLYGYNYGATVVIFILGWFTVCIAQYSLTTGAPPEPAIYHTMDTFEITPLTRPLYVLICYSFHIANWYHPSLEAANQALHIVFVLLPLLWLSGLLPPAEVLVLTLLEQAHVFLLGGTPYASNWRLLIGICLSTGVFLGCYFTNCLVAVVLAASTGYLLSTDLGSLGSQIASLCQRNNINRVGSRGSVQAVSNLNQPRVTGFLWSWCWSTVLYQAFMTTVVAAVAGVLNYHSQSIGKDVSSILGFVIIGVCVLEKVVRDLQGVFLLYGLVRNPLYPASTEQASQFHSRKKKLFVLALLRRFLVNWVGALVLVAYLSLRVTEVSVTQDRLVTGLSDAVGVMYVFGVVRAFRWSWQSTVHALLETSVVHLILEFMTTTSVTSDLDAAGLLLIVGICRDRAYQIFNKLYFCVALMITTWMDRKQRRSSTLPIILLNVFFFPIVLAIIVSASALSAPLLCLFTMPLYFIGYPRLSRFWPEVVGSSANNCPDTLFYRQLSTELSKALRSAFASGSLGEPNVGNHYLMRYQDRLVWTHILERGTGYCTVNIKGLELQETSCHTAEAARIDDQYKEAFEGQADGMSVFNNYPLHSLTPVDASELQTYSDAKNVLTGVIDSPDSVSMTLTYFIKSLVWVLLHHVNKRKQKEERSKQLKEQEIARVEEENRKAGKHLSKNEKAAKQLSKNEKAAKENKPRRDRVSVLNNNTTVHEVNRNVGHQNGGRFNPAAGEPFSLPPLNGQRTNLVQANLVQAVNRPESRESSRRMSLSSSLHSFTDSIWSDDEGDKAKKKAIPLKQSKLPTVVSLSKPSQQGQQKPMTSLPPINPLSRGGPGSLNDSGSGKSLDDFLTDFGLPAVDVNTPKRATDINFDDSPPRAAQPLGSGKGSMFSAKPSSKFAVPGGNHIYKPVMNLAGSPDFKCPTSSFISVPSKWRELPIERSQLQRYLSQFPTQWYKHTLTTLDWSLSGQPPSVATEVGGDDALTNCYSHLVMACYSAFDSPGRPGGASYLHKSYNGDVPWNAMMDWLSEDRELYTLVLRAFRYGFKLMLDQMLLGEISGDNELQEYLESYDSDWYIGSEQDAEWASAIMENKNNLFSLGNNVAQGTYTSRTLSRQAVMVHMGRVNREAVLGQWANLNLELLYMTNDDEERYSIQALPAMLRNLCVQAADPPLGYPIYSSPPISIPTV